MQGQALTPELRDQGKLLGSRGDSRVVRVRGPRREMSRLQLFANSCECIFHILSTGTAVPGPAGWLAVLVGSAEILLGRNTGLGYRAPLTVGSPRARAPQVFPRGWSGC